MVNGSEILLLKSAQPPNSVKVELASMEMQNKFYLEIPNYQKAPVHHQIYLCAKFGEETVIGFKVLLRMRRMCTDRCMEDILVPL